MKKKPISLIHLEEKYGFSFLKAIIFNLLAISTTIGITSQPKVDSVTGFFIFILLYTLLEVMTINLLKRYFMAWIIKTLGLALLLIYIMLVYASVLVVPDIRFMTTLGFILFILVFLVLRVLMMYYYDKFIQRRRRT